MSCLRSGVGSYCRRKRTIGGAFRSKEWKCRIFGNKEAFKKEYHSGAEIFEGLQLLLHEIIGLKKLLIRMGMEAGHHFGWTHEMERKCCIKIFLGCSQFQNNKKIWWQKWESVRMVFGGGS